MRAHIEKTVNGINLYLEGQTDGIAGYIANLGGKARDNALEWAEGGAYFFWSSDAKWVPEMLEDEGYQITRSAQ
jgi:hypothetical protein